MEKKYKIETAYKFTNSCKTEEITDLWTFSTTNEVYHELFGVHVNKQKKYPWARKIVKIHSKNTNLSLYRIWKGLPPFIEGRDILYIDKKSKQSLVDNNDCFAEIVLSKGNKLFFYWNHFDNATRISFKLGFLSVALGVLSLVFAFFI